MVNSRLLAAAIPFNYEGDPLLDMNTKYGRKVTPVGGKVEPGETPAWAGMREGYDEFGLHLAPVECIGTYPTTSDGEGKFMAVSYFCRIADVSPPFYDQVRDRFLPREPEKSEGADWYSLPQLVDLRDRDMLAPNLATLVDVMVNAEMESTRCTMDDLFNRRLSLAELVQRLKARIAIFGRHGTSMESLLHDKTLPGLPDDFVPLGDQGDYLDNLISFHNFTRQYPIITEIA